MKKFDKSLNVMLPVSYIYKGVKRGILWCSCFASIALPVIAAEPLTPQGEFVMTPGMKGDQVNAALAFNATNGYVAWEDNVIDKKGAGVGSALLMNFMPGKAFKANSVARNDQINPKIVALQNGEFAYVWQSRVLGTPDVFIRFRRNNSFYTGDIRVNTYTKDQQINPVASGLSDGGVIVVWQSYNQYSPSPYNPSMWDVYARKFTEKGKAITVKVGNKSAAQKEFCVTTNEFGQGAFGNQRNPAVATLASDGTNGNFVVVWASEMQRWFGDVYTTPGSKMSSDAPSVDIYARIFANDCTPVTGNILINSSTNACSQPDVAPTPDGGFTVVWTEKDPAVTLTTTNSLDIYGRAFSAQGVALADQFRINNYTYGDQYQPKIAAGAGGCMVVWTSLGQDGDREGIFGRFLANSPNGSVISGSEFQVNKSWRNQQLYPAVAWDEASSRFLVVWSSLSAGFGFDLYGQAYSVNNNQ